MYVKVHVHAGEKRESIVRKGSGLVLFIKEKAERNAANARARELVARAFKVNLKTVRIVSGHKNPSKMFEIKTP